MKRKTTMFVISFFSPLFPVLAVLILNKIGHALPLLILCMVLAAMTIWSITALVRVEEKSPVLKVAGTLMGLVGVVTAVAVSLLSGWVYTKL